MKRIVTLSLSCLFLSTQFLSGQLTIHEWGTFTTVHGSNGGSLSGLYLEEEHLPKFVHHHEGFSPDPLTTDKGLYKPCEYATVKMETPVLYFYSPEAVKASVTVRFPYGTISQWYPQRSAGEFAPGDQPTMDFSKPYNGWIRWDADVLAPGNPSSLTPPKDQETPTWTTPRETDANLVQVNSETEKFLFYRGVGNFDMPLSIHFTGKGQLEITNSSTETIPYLFVYDRSKTGTSVWWTGSLEAGASRSVEPMTTGMSEDALAGYFTQFQQALASAGLYPKEAAAMLSTWKQSYFGTIGTRVFWVVPRSLTDAILPLEVATDAKPVSVERVLVGRSEILSPSFENALVTDLKDEENNKWKSDRYYLAYKERYQQITQQTTNVPADAVNNTEMTISPNPAESSINLFAPCKAGSSVIISINTLQGRTAMIVNGRAMEGGFRKTLSIKGLATGNYIVRIQAGGREWTSHLVKE